MAEKNPLVDRYSQMHGQKDVTHELERINSQRHHQIDSGTPKKEAVKVPQRPAEKIDAFLNVLQDIHIDRDPQVAERIKQSLYREHCLDPNKPMPDSWFRTQAQMAQDQGHGLKDQVYEQLKAAYAAGGDARSQVESQKQALINDQHSSLDKWYDYLSKSDTPYPMWFRYFAITNAAKLGSFSKETHSFAKRSDDTTSGFPELNSEALVYVAESMGHHYGLSETRTDDDHIDVDDPRMQDLLKDQASFGDMYAHALDYCTPATAELLSETDGQWITYPKGTPGIELSSTLDGHGTGWCVAGESYAGQYLADGDFMVFYTGDGEGNYTTPRIGIPMYGTTGDGDYHIREVRGIRSGQNMEEVLDTVLTDKLAELPGSEDYMRAKADMALLTDIFNRHNSSEPLGKDDLRFLYKLDKSIVGFGESEDPRIRQIMENRDWMSDMRLAMDAETDNELANKLIDSNMVGAVVKNLNQFSGLDASTANKLIDAGKGDTLAYNLDRFTGLNHIEIANKLIDTGNGNAVVANLGKFTGLNHVEIANKLIDTGNGNAVVANLGKFTGLNHVEIANKLIEAGEGDSLAYNLGRFTGLNHVEIANKLIEAGEVVTVANHLDRFTGLNHIEIANKLIEAGRGGMLAYYLVKFSGLDASIANKLIDAGYGNRVIEDLASFTGLNNIEIANKLIDAGEGLNVAWNIGRFTGLDKTVLDRLKE